MLALVARHGRTRQSLRLPAWIGSHARSGRAFTFGYSSSNTRLYTAPPPPRSNLSLKTGTPPPTAPPRTLRDLTRKYGSVAIVLYLGMSFTTFWLTFVALWNGVDVRGAIQRVQTMVGWTHDDTSPPPATSTTTTTPTTENLETMKEKGEDKEWSWKRFGGTFVLAFAINKLYLPLKLPIIMLLTPRVARSWTRFTTGRRRSGHGGK